MFRLKNRLEEMYKHLTICKYMKIFLNIYACFVK